MIFAKNGGYSFIYRIFNEFKVNSKKLRQYVFIDFLVIAKKVFGQPVLYYFPI